MQSSLLNLHAFLEQNRTELFMFVENSRRPFELGNEDGIFGRLLDELVRDFPVCHCQPLNTEHAEFDKVHYEMAIAILQIFWCGCLFQIKENRAAYPNGT